MAHFIGRTRELKVLEQAHASRRCEMVPIYGRRRVGKSELILQFLRARRGIYCLGKRAPAAAQIQGFLHAAAAALDAPLLAEVSVPGWAEAFKAMMACKPKKGKLVVALDEFQWIAQACPELPSVLQGIFDARNRTGEADLMLILCGSYVGFMEREVLGQKSPLYGRRTAQILLKPFGFGEAREFFPRWGLAEAAQAFFTCGGVPYYLKCFDAKKSVEMNIRDTLLDEFSPLAREPDFLLREELKEVRHYYALLMALGDQALRQDEAADRSGIPLRSLNYYLATLEGLDYIARKRPLAPKGVPVRRVRFALSDPLLRFWFRFVYPNMDRIAQSGPAVSFDRFVRPGLDAYWGLCFESLCREALPFVLRREGFKGAVEAGEYWDDKVQFDVAGLRDDGRVELGECKWGSCGRGVEQELEAKLGKYPNPRGLTVTGRVFCRVKPARMAGAALPWHDLDGLYKSLRV